jgi:hypothetical protein
VIGGTGAATLGIPPRKATSVPGTREPVAGPFRLETTRCPIRRCGSRSLSCTSAIARAIAAAPLQYRF